MIKLLEDIGGIIEAERFSVMDRGTEFIQGIAVFFGGIAHVFVPAIMWKFLVEVDHQLVSIIFSQNRSRRNGKEFRISFNNALMRNKMIRVKFIPIHQD